MVGISFFSFFIVVLTNLYFILAVDLKGLLLFVIAFVRTSARAFCTVVPCIRTAARAFVCRSIKFRGLSKGSLLHFVLPVLRHYCVFIYIAYSTKTIVQYLYCLLSCTVDYVSFCLIRASLQSLLEI